MLFRSDDFTTYPNVQDVPYDTVGIRCCSRHQREHRYTVNHHEAHMQPSCTKHSHRFGKSEVVLRQLQSFRTGRPAIRWSVEIQLRRSQNDSRSPAVPERPHGVVRRGPQETSPDRCTDQGHSTSADGLVDCQYNNIGKQGRRTHYGYA